MRRSAIKLIIVAVLVFLAWQQFGGTANIQLDTVRLTLRGIDPLLVLILGGVGGYVVRSLVRG